MGPKYASTMEEREITTIYGVDRGVFSSRAITAWMQQNSFTVMRVWKQWMTKGDVNALLRSTPAPLMAMNDRTAFSRQLAARWSTATGVLMSWSSIHRRLLHHELPARDPLTVIHRHCVCNGLMSTDPGKLIGTKLSFQINHVSISETMKAAFVLDAMPVSAAFQCTFLNDKVAEHLELWSGVRFRIMDNPICYESRVISIATGKSVKCYSP